MGLETAHSPNAEDITTIYEVMLVVAVAFAVIINLALLYCIVRFRSGRDRDREPARIRGSATVQFRSAMIFAFLAVVLFVAAVSYTEQAEEVQADPLRVKAIGQQWLWRYEYPPSGAQPEASGESETPVSSSDDESFADVFSYYELVVPVDRTVIVDIDSTDVMHRWWVPELGGKFDAVPGRVNSTWFRADEEGIYDGRSAAFSGTSYAAMRTRVRVVSASEYEAWLSKQAADILAAQTAVQQQLAARTAPAAGGEQPAAAQAGTESSTESDTEPGTESGTPESAK